MRSPRVNNTYLERGDLYVETMGRGFAWLDTGNHDALLDAADFVAAFQKRQGLYISCIEEIAYKRGFITKEQLIELAQPLLKTNYGEISDRGCGRTVNGDVAATAGRQRVFGGSRQMLNKEKIKWEKFRWKLVNRRA